jgi:HSP20 family protein
MAQKQKQEVGRKSERREGNGGAIAVHHPRWPLLQRGEWPLSRLRSEIDQLFSEFFQGLPRLREEGDWRWGLDVEDRDDAVVVRAEAPGFEPDDFDLQVRGDELVLCACQKEQQAEGERREWRRRELYRSVSLPHGIDAEKVEAEYRNGILAVTLPKTEQSKGKRISVKGGA